jgi:hypothetical protein
MQNMQWKSICKICKIMSKKYAKYASNMQDLMILIYIACNMQNMQNNMHDMQNMQTSFPMCRICTAHFADDISANVCCICFRYMHMCTGRIADDFSPVMHASEKSGVGSKVGTWSRRNVRILVQKIALIVSIHLSVTGIIGFIIRIIIAPIACWSTWGNRNQFQNTNIGVAPIS